VMAESGDELSRLLISALKKPGFSRAALARS
jgi:hypothetical protein